MRFSFMPKYVINVNYWGIILMFNMENDAHNEDVNTKSRKRPWVFIRRNHMVDYCSAMKKDYFDWIWEQFLINSTKYNFGTIVYCSLDSKGSQFT